MKHCYGPNEPDTAPMTRRAFLRSAGAGLGVIGLQAVLAEGGLFVSHAIAQVDLLKDLQKPPAPLPDAMPKLSPLLVDDAGNVITTQAGWVKQRDVLKKKWHAFIGEFPNEKAPLRATVLATEELSDFTRQYVKYQIEEGVFTDGYLLTPKRVSGELPAVVVFHPTDAMQAKQVAGVDMLNPEVMGVQLVKRGYVVICPRCFIFDEVAGYTDNSDKLQEWLARFRDNVKRMQALHPNWTGMARMTYDGVRALDYLESLPHVDKNRIGCIGHSLGAKEALYAAAFDERYKVVVFSEGGIGLTFSNWDAVWYLGADIKQPDFNMEHHQVISLIAPRAFLLLAGNSRDDDRSWAFIEAVMPVYKLLGAANNIGWFNHRVGHRYPPNAQAVAEAFLDKHLK